MANSEIEEVMSFLPDSQQKAVDRLLKRATERKLKAQKHQLKKASSGRTSSKIFRTSKNSLAKQLGKALSFKGSPKKNKTSIKMTAPDTGGRPFHFAHNVITRSKPNGKSKSKTSTNTTAGKSEDEGKGENGSSKNGKSKSASHHAYIERESAVEKTREREPTIEEEIREIEKSKYKNEKNEISIYKEYEEGKGINGIQGQQYIENSKKLANGEKGVYSFGNIGQTLEERLKFWELVEKHEQDPDARIQNRLIIELPHEAKPETRYKIIKQFCEKLENVGLPYWAALHAPGEKNDNRNYHAHIVFTERPSKLIKDPEDGLMKWDFSIQKKYKTSSRNTKISYPYRQKRNRELSRIDAIPRLRKDFSEIANKALAEENCKTKDGKPVRYDSRSYKDMGLDTTPMKSVNRIVADKLNSKKFVVMDADWTKAAIERELKEAAARRDKDLMAIVDLERTINELSKKTRNANAANKKLLREMQVSGIRVIGSNLVKSIGREIIQAKVERLRIDLMERTTRTTLEKIIDATNPESIEKTKKNVTKQSVLANLPDMEESRLLHETARLELEEFDKKVKARKSSIKGRLEHALRGWDQAFGPEVPERVVTPTKETRKAGLDILTKMGTEPFIDAGLSALLEQPDEDKAYHRYSLRDDGRQRTARRDERQVEDAGQDAIKGSNEDPKTEKNNAESERNNRHASNRKKDSDDGISNKETARKTSQVDPILAEMLGLPRIGVKPSGTTKASVASTMGSDVPFDPNRRPSSYLADFYDGKPIPNEVKRMMIAANEATTAFLGKPGDPIEPEKARKLASTIFDLTEVSIEDDVPTSMVPTGRNTRKPSNPNEAQDKPKVGNEAGAREGDGRKLGISTETQQNGTSPASTTMTANDATASRKDEKEGSGTRAEGSSESPTTNPVTREISGKRDGKEDHARRPGRSSDNMEGSDEKSGIEEEGTKKSSGNAFAPSMTNDSTETAVNEGKDIQTTDAKITKPGKDEEEKKKDKKKQNRRKAILSRPPSRGRGR